MASSNVRLQRMDVEETGGNHFQAIETSASEV